MKKMCTLSNFKHQIGHNVLQIVRIININLMYYTTFHYINTEFQFGFYLPVPLDLFEVKERVTKLHGSQKRR